jgi:hypothetical protein
MAPKSVPCGATAKNPTVNQKAERSIISKLLEQPVPGVDEESLILAN